MDKTAEEIKREAAEQWINNCGDTEIKRMYGHHIRSFKGGWNASEEYHALRSREDKERIKELEGRIDKMVSGENYSKITTHYQLRIERLEKALTGMVKYWEWQIKDPLFHEYKEAIAALSGESKENL